MNKLLVPACFIIMLLLSGGQTSGHQLDEMVDGFKVGELATFDSLEFIDSKSFNLKQYRGDRLVVLFFWSNYFSHNHETLTLFAVLHQSILRSGAVALGINLDSKWNKVQATLKKYGIDCPHTYNPYLTFPVKLLASISQREGSVVVIDKNGKIGLLWQLVNKEDYEDIRQYLLKNGQSLH